MVNATPEDAIFTKEDAEMYRGLVNDLMRDTEFNVIDWIKTQADDPAKIEGFVNFINLRKTAAVRLEHKRLMLEYIQKDIDKIFEKKDEVIKMVGSIGSFEVNVGNITVITSVGIIACFVFKAAILAALAVYFLELEVLLLDRWALKDDILQRPLLEII